MHYKLYKAHIARLYILRIHCTVTKAILYEPYQGHIQAGDSLDTIYVHDFKVAINKLKLMIWESESLVYYGRVHTYKHAI